MQWKRPIEEGFFRGFRCPPIAGHTATAVGSKMLVIGGETPDSFSNSVYVLDTSVERVEDHDGDGTLETVSQMVWSLADTTGEPPRPRKGHTATLIFSKLYVFGGVGADKQRLNDLHVLDTETLTWSRPEVSGDVPEPREGHTATLVGNKLIVFGGWSGRRGEYFNDAFSFDPKLGVWQRLNVSGTAPTGRKGHSATLVGGARLYVLGGFSVDRRCNDLHVLDTGNLHWTQPEVKGNVPDVRSYHSSLLLDGKLFVWGGFSKGNRALNDFRSLDTGFFNWSLPAIGGKDPDLTLSRGGHTVCVINTKVYFFGGTNGSRLFNDILSIDMESEVRKMKRRYQFMKETYPAIFDQMAAAKAAGKKKVYWKSGLPFLPELPFSHTVYVEFPQEGKQSFTGKEEHFFLLADWNRFKMSDQFSLQMHPDFSNVWLVLE